MAKRSRVIWIALVLCAVAACKGKKQDTTPKNTSGSKIDASLCEESSKKVVTFDLNKDGKPDVWHLYANDVETCKIDDFDHDGNKDWVVAYDAKHTPQYKKADVDYDGNYDLIEVYEKGKLSEAERDTDFDGKMDVKEIYTDGQLTSVRRDRNADNKPDQWEQYSAGEVTSITYDDNFDGKVDRRSDDADGAPQAQSPAPANTTQPLTAPATPGPTK
jgi:hypothetical protein